MRILVAAAILSVITGVAPALADQPDRPPKPGVTLRAGQLVVTATAEINAGEDTAAEPVSLAPDVSYGVSDELTVMLVHSNFLATGFRGAGGKGLCLSGDDAGCPRLYDNVGVEVLYGLSRGPIAIGVGGGVHALSLDRDWYAAKIGARLRYQQGKLVAQSSPSVFVAVSHRDDDDATTPDNLDRLWLPLVVTYAVAKPLALGVATGVKGPLRDWGDGWELAAGVVGQYQLDRRFALGASLIFGKLVGGHPDADQTGPEHRWAHVWISYTR